MFFIQVEEISGQSLFIYFEEIIIVSIKKSYLAKNIFF